MKKKRIISKRKDVKLFLQELKSLLSSNSFNIDEDLEIKLKKKNESPVDPYTTANTLLALDFDSEDIKNQLLSLTVEEYIQTFLDDTDITLPVFYTFGKDISKREVYIKVKIRDKKNGKVFCVSFHFARYPFPEKFPYQ